MKKVLVLGSQERIEEFKNLKLENSKVSYLGNEDENIVLADFDFLFDLNLDDNPENLLEYNEYPNLVVFGCSVKESLSSIVYMMDEPPQVTLFGMNAFPGFIDRPLLECSCFEEDQGDLLIQVLNELGLKGRVVADRVGMVTPRIISMIINEAYFVVGEGTADQEGVNQAMKLGTNYPQGPFEWAESIGLDNVYELIEAMADATRSSKYKIAPALRNAYMRYSVNNPD